MKRERLPLRAAGTTLSGGTVTLNTTPDINLGQVTDGGVATTIVKQGSGRLIFDNTNATSTGQASSLVSGSIIEVQGGKLIARGISSTFPPGGGTNPLGAAQIRLNGGGLLLDTKQGSVTYDNAIAVQQNATIEALPNNNTVAATVVTLGGTNGISISGGSTLTFDMYGGARSTLNNPNSAVSTNGAGAALTLAGAITGTGNLVFRSSQFNQEQYPVYGTSTLNANNSIAGTVTLNGGYAFQGVANPLIITLNGQGRLSGTTGLTLNAAQLTLDDTATVNSGRINSTAPLTLRAGTLQVLAAAAAASGETLGAVTADAGFNRVIIANAPNSNVTATITGSSLVRNNRSVIHFQGQRLGLAADASNPSTQIKFTTAPALAGGGGAAGTATISILPYAFGAATTATNPPVFFPVTYDPATGIRPISTASETTALASTVANGNARDVITADVAPVPPPAGTATINSWTLDNNSNNTSRTATLTTNPLTFSDSGAGLLLLTSQNTTAQSALVIGGTAINFGAAEGKVIVTTTASATINSVIQGTSGLTVSGTNNINGNALATSATVGGSLTLTADNSAGLSGTITVNGRLVLNNGTSDFPLGNSANPVQFGGGTLAFNNAGTTLASTRIVTMLPNSFGVIDTNGNADTIAGRVTGSGGLVKINGGALTLNNPANDYSGPTTIFAGSLVTRTGPQGNYTLSSLAGNTLTFAQDTDGAYTGNITGVGSVQINNTSASAITITLGDPSDATKGVNNYGSGTTFANTNPVTLRGTTSSLVGAIVTQSNDSIVYEQSFDGTAGSLISGPAGVTKLGAGKVTVVNANSYTGATNINGGTLSISSAANLGNSSASNTIAISNGATLQATETVNLGATRTVAINSGGGKLDVPDAEDTLTVSGAISGAAGNNLTKTGFGKVSLTTANTYSGATNVEGGTLEIGGTGSIANTAGVNVSPGANFDVTALVSGYNVGVGSFLANNGTVTGSVVGAGTVGGSGEITGSLTINSGGTLAPGGSPGDLTVDGLTTFNSGSIFALELNGGTPGSLYDQLTVASSGGISITGGNVTLSLGFAPAFGQQFTVIENLTAGPISGVFSNLPNGGFITATFNAVSYDFVASYSGGTGNDLVLTVPEPTSAAVLAAGLGLCAGLRRFRRRPSVA